MPKHYFTFGFGQQHENGFHVIEADTPAEARDKMFERFGQKWSMHYEESQWYDENGVSQQEEYHLHEVK